MYEGMFDNPKTDMWQTCNAYEQIFGYVQVLKSQYYFPLLMTYNK